MGRQSFKGITASQALPHFGHLDALRGVAILGVLICHAAAVTHQSEGWSQPLYAGAAGVQLFYMVSAFTLFLSIDGGRRERKPLSNFFLRRFFRIAPLFYLVLLLSFLRLHVPQVHGYRPTPFEWMLGALFLFGFKTSTMATMTVGGWSIAVESTFYAVLPVLHRSIRSLKTAVIAAISSALVLFPFCHFLAERYPQDDLYFRVMWFPAEVPVFLSGIAMYFFWRRFVARRSEPVPYAKWIGLVCTIAAAVAMVLKHRHPPAYFPGDLPADTVIVALFLLGIVIHPGSFLVNPFTRFVGKISFSIYLLHSFVYEGLVLVNSMRKAGALTFFGFPFNQPGSFLVCLLLLTAMSVIVATLSWRYIEQPGIRLGRRIIAWNEDLSETGYEEPLPPLSSSLDTKDAQV